jgi:hypothetical protein
MKPTSLPLMMLALVGCADGSRGTEPLLQAPTPSGAIVTAMRATVDVAAGSLTFEPLPAASLSRGRMGDARLARVYGDQGVTVRLYNSSVVVAPSATAGKETYTANVGVQNVLAFPIGDEQAGATPVDTMGIYVFVTSGPTVTATSSACSPACTVTTQNHHGTLAFTSAGQHYWHWGERVGAAGGSSDTTLARRSWVFEADTQVTAFRFDVLVSAAWAAPNDTRWRVDFEGDSVPDATAEPRWRRQASGAAGTILLNTPSAGILTLSVPAAARVAFYQGDSLGTTTNAYLEARFNTNIATVSPEISFGIDDDVRFIGVGLTGTQVGFLTGTFGFLGTPVTATTTLLHTYQIRKFAADSVQLWMDGAWIDSRPYTAFSVSLAGLPYLFYWGGPGVGFPPLSAAGNSSSWDYVIYEIGATQP